MADTKQDVLDMLHELAELTILDEGDPQSFRVRAYESAAQSITAQASDLGRLTVKELQKIEGIGKSTAEKIRELLETGKVAKLEGLRAEAPARGGRAAAHPGPGPQGGQAPARRAGRRVDGRPAPRARRAQAARRSRASAQKSEEKLAQALARLDAAGRRRTARRSRSRCRWRRASSRSCARSRASRTRRRAARCAASRRRSATSTSWSSARRSGAGDGGAGGAARGRSRARARRARRPASSPAAARRSTCAWSRPRQLGAALLYFTGSKGHNIKLRQRALARGWTLNEYALSEIEGGKVDRQRDRGGDLPRRSGCRSSRRCCARTRARSRPPRPARCRGRSAPLCGDFHLHTTVSGDGRSSLEEMVAAARARGYRVLAITDHAEGTLSGVGREALLAQRARIRALQAELGDTLTLLHGVELNIGADGELDYDAEFRRAFDWCLASVHDHFELDRAAQTRRIVTAMQDPSVRMIGHLSARMIGGRPPIDLDYDAGVRRRRGDRHRAGGQRRPAAPGPVGRGAAPRARPQRHLRARPATRTRRASSSASATRRSTPSARASIRSASRTPGTAIACARGRRPKRPS